jgi:hypothetical protein
MSDIINTQIRISEWLETMWNKFFGKKPETITEPVQEEQIQEKSFEELIAEKLDEVFNCNHNCAFRPLEHYENGFDTLVDMVVHKKFRYNRHKNFYSIEIYDATEPELREVVYICELRGTMTFRFYGSTHQSKMYNCFSEYKSGIWDESFLETLNELVEIKVEERKIKEEKRLKQIEQEQLDKKMAEEVKQDRIRKMFEKNT